MPASVEELEEDLQHYRRIADAFKLENDAHVDTIQQLREQLTETETQLRQAEAVLDAGGGGGHGHGHGDGEYDDDDDEGYGESAFGGTDDGHSFQRGASGVSRRGNSAAFDRLSMPRRRRSSGGALGMADEPSMRSERHVYVTKVMPKWVFGANHQNHSRDDLIDALRGSQERIAALEAELRRDQQKNQKSTRDYETKLQDMQRKLNKKDEELQKLKRPTSTSTPSRWFGRN